MPLKQPKTIVVQKVKVQLIRRFNKFHLCWKKLNNDARSSRPKTVNSEAVLKAKEANPANDT